MNLPKKIKGHKWINGSHRLTANIYKNSVNEDNNSYYYYIVTALTPKKVYLVELVECPRFAIWFRHVILAQPLAAVSILVVFFVHQRVTALQFAMNLPPNRNVRIYTSRL